MPGPLQSQCIILILYDWLGRVVQMEEKLFGATVLGDNRLWLFGTSGSMDLNILLMHDIILNIWYAKELTI